MSGNSTGRIFVLTTAGESHGPAMLGIVDGCPSGLALSELDIQCELEKRRTGLSRYTSQRQEPDRIQILSGVFEGKTTGTSIGLLIHNVDAKPKDYEKIKNVFRPGHADFTYFHKYGRRDYRGGGRASARETAMWVACGAIAKKYLREKCDLKIQAYVSAIGDIQADEIDLSIAKNNPFYFPDKNKLILLENLLTKLRREGDSMGARVDAIASNVPIGLGEPVFDKLDAEIAKVMMSIPAAKGVEIGDGFSVVTQKGSGGRDAITPTGFVSNHAGGILGGISTGQDILVRVAFKPTSSIITPIQSIDIHHQPVIVKTTGRHDPCVGIRAVPIVEARLAMVLMDLYLRAL